MLLDVSQKEDNTIVLVTHDVSEAVYVADTCYVLATRPTHVLHRIDVPSNCFSTALRAMTWSWAATAMTRFMAMPGMTR